MVEEVIFLVAAPLISLIFVPCLLPCLITIISSTIQASTRFSETTAQAQTKIMMIESQEREHKTANRVYDQYQKLQKFSVQETEITNLCGLKPDQKERGGIL